MAQELGARGRYLVESEYDWLQIMKKECKEYDESFLIGRGSI